MTDYRKRLEAVVANLAKYDDDCTLARAYGGPTMLPRHPIDEPRARQIGNDLRSLLSEADDKEAEITRLRSLVEEAGKVVGETEAFYDRVPTPHHPGETAILDELSALRFKLKSEGQ